MQNGKTVVEHCAEIGRYGGLSKSDAKKKAARENISKARCVVEENRRAKKLRKVWNHGWRNEYL